ncbi:MAG: CRISPR-associated endonuclease Cas2 [Egibacteraceae bacterium]
MPDLGHPKQNKATQGRRTPNQRRSGALVFYDITHDRLRTEVAETCRDFGLGRVQCSCFAGDLSRNPRQMLEIRLRALLARDIGVPTDAIYALPLCSACFDDKTLLGFEARFPDRRHDHVAVI